MPRVVRPEPTPVLTWRAVSGSWEACAPMPYPISQTWVIRNRMKMGASVRTDSRTPRLLIVASARMSTISATSLSPCHWNGRKLNRASPAAAMDVVIVST